MKTIKVSTSRGIGLFKLIVIVGCIGLVVFIYNGRKAAIEQEREAAAMAYAKEQNEKMLKEVQDNMANAMMEAATKSTRFGGGAKLDPEIQKQLEEANQFNNNYNYNNY